MWRTSVSANRTRPVTLLEHLEGGGTLSASGLDVAALGIDADHTGGVAAERAVAGPARLGRDRGVRVRLRALRLRGRPGKERPLVAVLHRQFRERGVEEPRAVRLVVLDAGGG